MQPTVILIHGATLNGASWAPVRRLLEPDFRVIAPDLPGHGSRRGERFTLQGAVDTVVAAAAAVPGPFILAGDSLGGYTAQAAAAALPRDRLKGLVLGGSSHEFIGAPARPYLLKAWLFRATFALMDERKTVAKKVPGLLREFGLAEADVQATMDAGMSLAVFADAVAALHGFDFKARLAAIEQPTLFINGDLDRPHVRGEAAYVAAARDASVQRLAGCEHGVSLRRSADYGMLVRRFAGRVLA